ncbi:hypothetical protein V6M85_11455 [Sulfolobus tengchongensis]|uniref:SWIM-type domain-containing protein n=1 Tax=Sulfolobus tengchongensis TaxID=207809 RepID=A0AAX4L0G4_9CREN
MIRIISINSNSIEGFVDARCATGSYHVKIRIDGFKIIESECECGEKFCRHAVQLYLHYMRVRSNANHDKTLR